LESLIGFGFTASSIGGSDSNHVGSSRNRPGFGQRTNARRATVAMPIRIELTVRRSALTLKNQKGIIAPTRQATHIASGRVSSKPEVREIIPTTEATRIGRTRMAPQSGKGLARKISRQTRKKKTPQEAVSNSTFPRSAISTLVPPYN